MTLRSRFGALATLAVALWLAAATLWLIPPNTFQAVYGSLLYPALSAILASLTGWTAIPLGMATLPLLTGILTWRLLAGDRRTRLLPRLGQLALLATVLLAAYQLAWGVNYRRPALPALLQLAEPVSERADLEELSEQLLAWLLATSEANPDSGAALAAVAAELELLTLELGWPARVPRLVKSLPPGTLLRAGYAGMLFPFSLEAQVDAGLASHSRVSVGAHELAHAAGFAGEADADLAALLAGFRADHPFARYSTALSLLVRTLPSLSASQRGAVLARLPRRAAADLAEARLRATRFLRPSLSARVTAIYDRVLRGQGVSAGVSDYGRAPLLAARALHSGLLPVPPTGPGSGESD